MEWEVRYFDQLVSTNETAKSFPPYTAIVATSQTGGKGRYGRVWESPAGNLYLSVVVPEFGSKTPLLAFVAGVAVAEALSDFGVRIKWPNDILLNGQKLAGLLLEQREDKHIVIGIGINVLFSPTNKMLYPTASLNGNLSVRDVQNRVLNALKEELDLFREKGFLPIREKWLDKAVGIGQIIEIHLPTQNLIGLFKALSPQGELVLETPDKAVHKITAGDVFFI